MVGASSEEKGYHCVWSIVNSVIYLVHNKGVQGRGWNGYEVAGPAVISGQSYHKSDHEWIELQDPELER